MLKRILIAIAILCAANVVHANGFSLGSAYQVVGTSVGVQGLETLPRGQILGTATNDNAVAGNIGEFSSSAVQGIVSTTTTHYQDITTISLTAGDWEISATYTFLRNGSTWTDILYGVSAGTAGDTFSDGTLGDNEFHQTPNGDWVGASVAGWRASLSTTTTIRLKTNITYTGAIPFIYGRLSARRKR